MSDPPAEIRAMRMLGADTVGMSSAPEDQTISGQKIHRRPETVVHRFVHMKERTYHIHAGIPCTIAHLSDLHNADGRRALEILRRRRPDLVAVTGDLVLGYQACEGQDLLNTQHHILPLIRECVRLAPTYISLGNHEWVASPRDMRALEEAGAVILDNSWIRDAATGLVIGGLTSAMLMDYRRFRKRHSRQIDYPHEIRHTDRFLLRPDTGWLQQFEAQEGFKVLLCHHPEYWCLQDPMLIDHPLDLVLAGHAHGGQIRLFGRGLYAPGQGVLPRYTDGVHPGPHGCMVISRGMSNTAPRPIPRLYNPTEVIFIDLR